MTLASRLGRWLVLWFSLAAVACSAGDSKGGDWGACDNASASGYQSLTANGVTREYILQLPAGYDASTADPLPLIINFHGNGGCAARYSQGLDSGASDLTAIADTHNVIVAYPQGMVRAKGAAEWNPADAGGSDLANNDVYFSQQLIAEISTNYAIDATRIYAVGYSNGGMMAYGLACHLGDQIAAIGIMAGIMLDGQCDTSNYTPVIHFHGTADGALPYSGNQDYRSVAEVMSFWVNHNQIAQTEPTTTSLNGGSVTLDTYTGGAEGSSVMLYTIQDGGHIWFADDIGGESPNAILWRFLSGYSVNGAI